MSDLVATLDNLRYVNIQIAGSLWKIINRIILSFLISFVSCIVMPTILISISIHRMIQEFS